jgi:hypothetical protein
MVARLASNADEDFETGMFPEAVSTPRRLRFRNEQTDHVAAQTIGDFKTAIGRVRSVRFE